MTAIFTRDARPADESRKRAPLSTEEQKKRQSELLDEGLQETFPASDPVSVVRVH